MFEKDEWSECWESGNTPWQSKTADEPLIHRFSALREKYLNSNPRVLVPLCGDSSVIKWLSDQAVEVVGVEYVSTAALALLRRDFSEFPEEKVERPDGSLAYRTNRGMTSIVVGDFFTFTDKAGFDLIYDRAAMIALPEHLRAPYAEQIRSLLKPQGVLFLESMEFIGPKFPGPPYSITENEIASHYPSWNVIEREVRLAPSIREDYKARGVTAIRNVTSIFEKS